jgi:hypothetical protein
MLEELLDFLRHLLGRIREVEVSRLRKKVGKKKDTGMQGGEAGGKQKAQGGWGEAKSAACSLPRCPCGMYSLGCGQESQRRGEAAAEGTA